MMVSDEEKRWLVVGIAMNKVAAPVLRDYIKRGMVTHYVNLDIYCSGLTTPCTLKTLTYHHVSSNPSFKHLKFQNVNNNLHLYGKHKHHYNYNINNSVDLAKLFLPDYLAEFSAFDESLDMSAILRLLGFNKPAPIFPSPSPLISIQMSADDVRENVRNKWGHCNVTDWTDVLFNDCFSKLETLVRSLGLTGGILKTTLDQLSDWQTKGCQLCMGHAVDKDLLFLVQREVKGIIKDLALHDARLDGVEEKLQEEEEARRGGSDKIMERLVSIEKILNEELLRRVQGVEEGLAATDIKVKELEQEFTETDDKVKQLEQEFDKTDNKVVQLEQEFAKTDDNVEQLGQGLAKTDESVEELVQVLAKTDCKVGELGQGLQRLEREVKSQKKKDVKPDMFPWPAEPFDVKTCRSKLADHYKRTATVPTSVWSKTSPVEIHQIYTRLSWVKEEQTPAGSSQSELSHYTDVFTANKNGVVPKRILVQGQTGIGKSTFVKKLALDWAELDDEKERDKQKDVLKKFELLVVVCLKEVSKCRSLKDVISRSSIFPRDEKHLTDGLLNYITNNQEKVLLVFDGYDEYRCGMNSDIYEIFRRNELRNCCVLITTRISKADQLREFKDVHAEITGFSKEDREAFMSRMLGGKIEAEELAHHLSEENLEDLARVPLLVLFFCTLWKKGKLESFPGTKTKLYLLIVQYVLDYNQGKDSPTRFGKVFDFKKILTEIGKVALECLLKDDHVLEYDQLSAAILGDESLFTGFLQVSEYAENLRPAGMVSFIHKSIQEFLAAWYITYVCVPEGNLGRIEPHARTLEDFQALGNVFQFICGLSDDAAGKVLQHLTSVRISDPTLDLSKIIPDFENETDVPLCDVTDRHRDFSDLVFNLFREVQSKAKTMKHLFDCTAGIILVTPKRPFSILMPETGEDLNQVTFSGPLCFCTLPGRTFCSPCPDTEDVILIYEVLEFLDCIHVSLRMPDDSAIPSVRYFLLKFLNVECDDCGFFCFLRFHNGEIRFRINDVLLCCDDHARIFTETESHSAHLFSATLLLNFVTKSLTCLRCSSSNGQTMKKLGAVISKCERLETILLTECGDGISELLEQAPNPTTYSLEINGSCSSNKAEELAGVLPRFNNIFLRLTLSDCCATAVNKLVLSITHNTLRELVLSEISLTPAVAAALGRSLPEMSSLRDLWLCGVKSILEVEEMEALFRGFNKTFSSLVDLALTKFNARGSLAPLTERLHFFSNLKKLYLDKLNMDERDLHGLLESLRSRPNLRYLSLKKNPFVDGARVSSIVQQALPQLPRISLY